MNSNKHHAHGLGLRMLVDSTEITEIILTAPIQNALICRLNRFPLGYFFFSNFFSELWSDFVVGNRHDVVSWYEHFFYSQNLIIYHKKAQVRGKHSQGSFEMPAFSMSKDHYQTCHCNGTLFECYDFSHQGFLQDKYNGNNVNIETIRNG